MFASFFVVVFCWVVFLLGHFSPIFVCVFGLISSAATCYLIKELNYFNRVCLVLVFCNDLFIILLICAMSSHSGIPPFLKVTFLVAFVVFFGFLLINTEFSVRNMEIFFSDMWIMFRILFLRKILFFCRKILRKTKRKFI